MIEAGRGAGPSASSPSKGGPRSPHFSSISGSPSHLSQHEPSVAPGTRPRLNYPGNIQGKLDMVRWHPQGPGVPRRDWGSVNPTPAMAQALSESPNSMRKQWAWGCTFTALGDSARSQAGGRTAVNRATSDPENNALPVSLVDALSPLAAVWCPGAGEANAELFQNNNGRATAMATLATHRL